MTFNHFANTYSVDIMVNGRMKRIGTFYTQKEAIDAYKEAERHYYPERSVGPEKVDRATLPTTNAEPTNVVSVSVSRPTKDRFH